MDLAVIMVVAAIMLAITFKLKQPMVIGYIIAGMIIGPYTPPFSLVSSIETVSLMAEIGIILLLFTVGTEYPIAKLRSIGGKAIVIALSEALGTFAIGYFVGQQMGMALFDSLFLALSISVTSTVIVMRVLEELGMVREESAYLLLGVAVIEDIIIVSMLAILQSVASTGDLAFQEITVVVGVVLAFIGGVLFLGSRTIPKLVDIMGKTDRYDLILITVLAVAFGLSFIADAIGISVATGAFFAGVLVAESKTQAVAKIITIPLRDMFGAVFFISVGALMDIRLIPSFIVPALILIATSFGAKFGTVFASAKMLGLSKKVSARAGFGLSASGGELALVTAKGGADVGATSAFLLPMIGAMTIITTFLSPYVIRLGWKITKSPEGEPAKGNDNNSNKAKDTETSGAEEK
ncbi:putative Na+(Li+)/H+ antiporter [Candidatus Nitrososphaera gargensis Ga9.2]|uniref:Putative Na+(Li+)/H+ antiporter n=2 Tax=Candidatus Nitrososphaera gargensis TaxID=497727 RepID=K0IDF3_NITGG|nr:putative Na+(Li+)/H+ antiporter [Candidatus Nitrososphaera gargensis Ga9.2]